MLMGPKAESGKARSEPGNSQNLYFIFLVILQQTTDNFILLRGTVGEVCQVWENLWN